MKKEKSSIGFGLGLLAGVVGGIVAGILYAPCPGSEMREKVKGTVCDLAEKYSPEVKEAKKQALESVVLLKYNWHLILCKFKVYNMLIDTLT